MDIFKSRSTRMKVTNFRTQVEELAKDLDLRKPEDRKKLESRMAEGQKAPSQPGFIEKNQALIVSLSTFVIVLVCSTLMAFFVANQVVNKKLADLNTSVEGPVAVISTETPSKPGEPKSEPTESLLPTETTAPEPVEEKPAEAPEDADVSLAITGKMEPAPGDGYALKLWWRKTGEPAFVEAGQEVSINANGEFDLRYQTKEHPIDLAIEMKQPDGGTWQPASLPEGWHLVEGQPFSGFWKEFPELVNAELTLAMAEVEFVEGMLTMTADGTNFVTVKGGTVICQYQDKDAKWVDCSINPITSGEDGKFKLPVKKGTDKFTYQFEVIPLIVNDTVSYDTAIRTIKSEIIPEDRWTITDSMEEIEGEKVVKTTFSPTQGAVSSADLKGLEMKLTLNSVQVNVQKELFSIPDKTVEKIENDKVFYVIQLKDLPTGGDQYKKVSEWNLSLPAGNYHSMIWLPGKEQVNHNSTHLFYFYDQSETEIYLFQGTLPEQEMSNWYEITNTDKPLTIAVDPEGKISLINITLKGGTDEKLGKEIFISPIRFEVIPPAQ